MHILLEESAREYCSSGDGARDEWWERLAQCQDRPACVLPWFELCRAVHYAASAGRLNPKEFRACWTDFADRHAGECQDGHLVHLLDSGDSADGLLQDIFSLGPFLSRDARGEEDEEDDRDGGRHHHALTSRLRRLHECAWERNEEWSRERLSWGTSPPEEMPDPSEQRPTSTSGRPDAGPDVVLDTNVALELLNKLPLDGVWRGTLALPQRIKEASESMVRKVIRLLAGQGAPGKLILPASALEEADRVIQRKGRAYQPARDVLKKMAYAEAWPLRSAFSIEGISMDVFNAFLHLHEALFMSRVARERWPRLGDALVIAHGIRNRCVVASTEWKEGQAKKMDWEALRHMFPFLAPQ